MSLPISHQQGGKRIVGGPGVVVGARVVFPVVHLAVGLSGFVEFVDFTGTGGILTALWE